MNISNPKTRSKGRLLVVDDSADSLRFLTTMLSSKGYDVLSAMNGKNALDIVDKDIPDLILLDIRMPVMDGFEVCRKLKANSATKEIPVIFISALDHLSDKVMAFNAGGVDYIIKPFQILEVLARIDTHLMLRNMQKRNKKQNAVLRQEISERRKAERALKGAYEEMEARVAERTKDLAKVNTDLLGVIREREKAEKALTESEEKFRQLAEHVQDVFWLGTVENPWRILYLTPAFERMWGMEREDVYRNNGNWFDRIHKDDKAYVIEIVEKSIKEETTFDAEFRITPQEGVTRWIWARGFPIKNEAGEVYRTAGIVQDITERKEAETALKESEKTLRYLTAHLINAQEKERKRISIELHDELGQGLMTLKLRIRSVQKKLFEDQASLSEDLEEVLSYIDHVMENTRRLSKDLSPSILEDLGLQASLDWLLSEADRNYLLNCRKSGDNLHNIFRKEDEIIVFRIFQEALNNIGKHSSAENVHVNIRKEPDRVDFSISDDGKGFDVESIMTKKSPRKGLGLFAMKERARMVNGEFKIVSEKNSGTKILFSIPIK